MRIEKEGFVLHLEGTWCEISNKYAVLESGDVAVNEEDIPAGFAEKKLDRYIETHKIRGYGKVDGCVKRVACDEGTKEYIQLQAVKLDDDTYMVQEFDNELVFMGELWSGCKYPDEVLDWMKSNYEIESCLTAEVYRSSLGDCTNNGISSYARELYILDAQKGPFEPDDIRQKSVRLWGRSTLTASLHTAENAGIWQAAIFFTHRTADSNRLPGSATRLLFTTDTKGGRRYGNCRVLRTWQ